MAHIVILGAIIRLCGSWYASKWSLKIKFFHLIDVKAHIRAIQGNTIANLAERYLDEVLTNGLFKTSSYDKDIV